MDTVEKLHDIVAKVWQTPLVNLTDDFPLAGRQSIQRAKLDAGLRRVFRTKYAEAYTAKTLGELRLAVLEQPASEGGEVPAARPQAQAPAPRPAAQRPTPPSVPAVSVGLDIELVANFPELEDNFYTVNYSPAEIAYCVAQPEPVVHFAARWCVKEALKKCDNSFMDVGMAQIEVVAEPSGSLRLQVSNGTSLVDIPHSVSVSHTSLMAAAVVVTVPG